MLPEWDAGVTIDALGAWGGLGIRGCWHCARCLSPRRRTRAAVLAGKIRNEPLSALDSIITSEKLGTKAGKGGAAARRKGVRKHVEWLNPFTRFNPDSHRPLHAFMGRKASAEEDRFAQRLAAMAAERAAQTPLQRVQDSFEAVGPNATLTHPDPAKAHLRPTQVWSVVPDEALWPTQLVHVVFPTEPVDLGAEHAAKRAAKDGGFGPTPFTRQRARLSHSVIRTPSTGAVSVAAGLVGTLALPAEASVPGNAEAARLAAPAALAAGDAAQATAPADEPAKVDGLPASFLLKSQQYNLTVKPYAHPHAYASENPTTPATTASQLVLVWDHDTGIVRLLPLAARVELTDVLPTGTAEDVLLHRRTCTADEVAAASEARAGVVSDDLVAFKHQQAQATLQAAKQQYSASMQRLQAQRAGQAAAEPAHAQSATQPEFESEEEEEV